MGDEEAAFKVLIQLMHGHSLRQYYQHDMGAIRVVLYQLARLLHDRLPEIYSCFERHGCVRFSAVFARLLLCLQPLNDGLPS